MAKKIAVLVRDRQEEALRMAVGITLQDDQIDVYVLDKAVEDTEGTRLSIETMQDLDMKTFTNATENAGMELLTNEEIALRLLEYDHIVPY